MRFSDRHHAGRELAVRLGRLELRDPVVLALPRGGVPIGYEIARALDSELDVLVVRKIGAPAEPEFGVGAVTADAPPYYDRASLAALGMSEEDLTSVVESERREVHRRAERYRRGRPEPEVAGKAVIVVDDGVATGGTARAALRSVRRRRPGGLVFAAPVCAAQAVAGLREDADEVVCLHAPEEFMAVGQWYDEFPQLSDDEVIRLLEAARRIHLGH